MLFNSWQFMVFFAAVAGCYFLLMTDRIKTTQIMLLGASLYFYASWNPVYLVLILFSVGVTWASGLFMEKYPAKKKLVLATSLILNLSILFFFKYFNFFSELVNRAGMLAGAKKIINCHELKSIFQPCKYLFVQLFRCLIGDNYSLIKEKID